MSRIIYACLILEWRPFWRCLTRPRRAAFLRFVASCGRSLFNLGFFRFVSCSALLQLAAPCVTQWRKRKQKEAIKGTCAKQGIECVHMRMRIHRHLSGFAHGGQVDKILLNCDNLGYQFINNSCLLFDIGVILWDALEQGSKTNDTTECAKMVGC